MRPRHPWIALFIMFTAGATRGAAEPGGEDRALEARVRRVLATTFVHGVSEELAERELGAEAMPLLLRLLDDETFERPDNVLAFLWALADDQAVPALLARAERERGPPASPERLRARLLLSRSLERIAARGGPQALQGLVELAEGGRRVEPELAAQAAESLGRIGLPGYVSELRGDPPRFPQQADPDPAGRFEVAGLDFANHRDVDAPMTAARLDEVLAGASLRAGRADFAADVACCFAVERSGPPRWFGQNGDGLDVIDDATEFAAVRANGTARVKVVDFIGHCFGQNAANIAGCAEYGGDSMIVVRLGSASLEGLVWLHEFGHNVGIREHDPRDGYIMNAFTRETNDALSLEHCARFHSPEAAAEAQLVDAGPCLDRDADDVHDGIDNCLLLPNFDQADLDGDGQGDACDDDDDGDGVPDGEDACPGLPDGPDVDGDGVPACLDGCPLDPGKTAPGTCGCGSPDTDRDGDGVLDCLDACPDDRDKTSPGACGCGVADRDRDGDGRLDCQDGCPDDASKTAPGACGCGVSDRDRDRDGSPDCLDGCPDDAQKLEAGTCGCGVPDLDGDGDGQADCLACVFGDLVGSNGLVNLADWVAGRRIAWLGTRAPGPRELSCGNLAPGLSACAEATAPERWCPLGGDGFDVDDVVVLRGFAAGTRVLSCQGCDATLSAPGAERRLPGDIVPRAPEGLLPGNGRVDVGDVLQALRWSVALDRPLTAEEFLRADVDPAPRFEDFRVVRGNDRIDVADIIALLRIAVRLDRVVWPERQLALDFVVAPSHVAFQAALGGWPPWATPTGLAGADCFEDESAGWDLAALRLVATCASDPALQEGPREAARVFYRAPEPVDPVGFATSLSLVGPELQARAGSLRLRVPAGD